MAPSEEAASLPARSARAGGTSIADVLAAVVTLVGLGVTSVAIRRELTHPVRAAAPRVSFAALARADGAVKVRDGDSLVWDLAVGGEALARGDAVFVPSDGFAEVRFDDGSTLSVEASSLVVLDARDDPASGPNVRLRAGGVTARLGATGLTFFTPDAQAELSPSAQASVSLSSEGSHLELASGAAVVRGAGASSELRAGGALEATRGGLRPVESAGTLLAPGPSARRYFAGNTASVRFEWQAPDPEVMLELADDRAFTRLLSSRAAQGRSVTVPELAPGAYFWRVRAHDGSWTTSPRALLLVRDRPPDPISPTRGQVLYLPGATVATFRWSEVSGAPRYEVQIADDATFARPRLDTSVDRPELRLGPFAPEGVYLWRARAVDPERGQSPWAEPVPFRLVIEPLPAPPELYDPELDLAVPRVAPPLVPRPDHRGTRPAPARHAPPPVAPPPVVPPDPHGFWWRLVGGVALAAAPAPPAPDATQAPELSVLLRWSSVPGVTQYVLEIAEDVGFRHVVLRERVAEPWYRWRTTSRRPHYWRVQSIDAKGREGSFSAPRQLSAVLGAPALLAPADGATVSIAAAPPAVALEWQPERLAYGYIVEVATDPGLARVVHRESVADAGGRFVPPGPGVYYWRVRAIDGAGGDEDSEARRLVVVLGAPVPAPVAARVLGPGDAFNLSATTIAGAQAYELEVARGAQFAAPLLRERRLAPSLVWAPPGPGRWSWRVRAVSAAAVSPWSAVAELVAALPPPVVRSPRAGAVVPGRVALLPVTVELEVVPGAEAYRLELKAEGIAARAETVTTTTWTSPPLPAGSWTLSATAVARGASSEPTRVAFRRTQAPPLTAPVPTTPDDAARIVFWAAPPPVTLAWQAVSDAAGYELELDAPEATGAAPAPPRAPLLRVAGAGHELAGATPGAHRWRVRAVDAAGQPGPWSTVRTLWLGPAHGAVTALTVDPAPVPVGRPTPAHVRLEVRDPDGTPVTGELRAQALHGSLGALKSLGAGVFVGDYVAPSEGRLEFDELVLERAGESAVPAARLPLLPAARLRAGVSGGAVANFAAPIAAQVALDADYRLARVLGGLWATVRVGYHQKQLSTSGAVDASAVQHSVPLVVGGRLSLLHGPVVPYAGAGVMAALFVSTVRVEGQAEDERSAWGLGLEAAAGCELAGVGPGSAYGEARWARLRATAAEVAYDGGGLAVAVGYRLDLW